MIHPSAESDVGAAAERERTIWLLGEIADLPTAPFHEWAVLDFIAARLAALGLKPTADPFGNLIAIRPGGTAPAIALVAHTDHPAFEIVEAEGSPRALLLGGVRPEYFRRPVPIRVCGSRPTTGRIVGATTSDDPRRTILDLDLEGPVATGEFGVFDLPSFEQRGELLRLRAADDLVGCAAILLTLERLGTTPTPGPIYAVFTRAEEVGLVGATLVAEQRLLPADTIVISLEASRELPGAIIGAGPVIRVGDVSRTFHPEGEAVLARAVQTIRERRPEWRAQRQLMSGGTCEATSFGALGYRTTGVALPLGNYHNMGADFTIAPEYVHLDDLMGEVDLLVAAAQIGGQAPADDLAKRLLERASGYRDRLAASAGDRRLTEEDRR